VSLYRFRLPRAIRSLRHRVGFRGYFLLTLGVVDIAMGLSFIRPGSPGIAVSNSYLAAAIPFHDLALSNWTWAFAWWLVAAFCFVNAFKVGRDHWGFGMAVAIKVAYVVASIYAVQHGQPDGWRRVIVWSFITSSVWVMSRWPEPARTLAELNREIEETGDIPGITGEPDA
jgi:hypothetical protein